MCQSAITVTGLCLTFSPCWFWLLQPGGSCCGGIWGRVAREERGSGWCFILRGCSTPGTVLGSKDRLCSHVPMGNPCLVTSGLCLTLAGPQPQDCHTVVVRLSHTCTQGRFTKTFSSDRKGSICAHMKRVKISYCIGDAGKSGCFFVPCVVSRIVSFPGAFSCLFLLV